MTRPLKRRILEPIAALFIAALLALIFTYISDKMFPCKGEECNAVAGYVR
jgi:hypothetical protein